MNHSVTILKRERDSLQKILDDNIAFQAKNLNQLCKQKEIDDAVFYAKKLLDLIAELDKGLKILERHLVVDHGKHAKYPLTTDECSERLTPTNSWRE